MSSQAPLEHKLTKRSKPTERPKCTVQRKKDAAPQQTIAKKRHVTRFPSHFLLPSFHAAWRRPSCLCKIRGWGRSEDEDEKKLVGGATQCKPCLSLSPLSLSLLLSLSLFLPGSCWQEHKGKIEFIVMSAVYLCPAGTSSSQKGKEGQGQTSEPGVLFE